MRILTTAIGMTTAAALLFGAELTTGPSQLVTHEWGTFTSVAQENGNAVEWAPLLGPPDLPCFVTRGQEVRKAALKGLVRMETPVLYFYSPKPTTLSVHVSFPHGLITEWYPNPLPSVKTDNNGWGSRTDMWWNQLHVLPGKDLNYPVTEGPSHYYAARNTDSTPLRIGTEEEKMIFYRGLGNFAPPLRALYDEAGRLEIHNTGAEPIPFAIAFENQRGAVGFRIAENVASSVTLDAPELTQDLPALRQYLVAHLTGLGLYPKEALAMVDTWADSWFTEGSRVFYIVPRPTVDALLPLSIAPAPTEIQRVFVGRLEVLSPRTKDTIQRALRAGDSDTLTAFGRFLEPFIAQIQREDRCFVLSLTSKTYLHAIETGQQVSGDGYGGTALKSGTAACVE